MSCQPKFINPLGMSIWVPPKGDDKNTGNGPFLVLLSISMFTTRASTLQVQQIWVPQTYLTKITTNNLWTKWGNWTNYKDGQHIIPKSSNIYGFNRKFWTQSLPKIVLRPWNIAPNHPKTLHSGPTGSMSIFPGKPKTLLDRLINDFCPFISH